MVLSILFLLSISMIVLVIRVKSRYTLNFVISFLSVSIMMFAILLYTFQISNFQYLFKFEYTIYRMFKYTRLNYFSIKSIINIGIVMFFIAMYGFFCGSEAMSDFSRKRKRWMIHTVFFSTVIIYLFLNSSYLSEYLYIFSHSKNDIIVNLSHIIKQVIVMFNTLITILICILPYFMLIKEYKKTKLIFRKKHILITMLSLAIIQLIFFIILSTNVIQHFINRFDLHNIGTSIENGSDLYIILPIIVILLLMVLGFIFLKGNVLDETNFFQKREALKKSKILTSDIRHIFHSYKNTLMSISTLCDEALETENNEIYIKKIKDSTEIFAEQAKRFLDMYKKPKLNLKSIDIINCINFTLLKMNIPQNIIIKKNYSVPSAFVFADFENISEMLYNLILNSAESISNRGINDGEIKISVWIENKWVCISILDNGGGIDKKMKKHMFQPFYSTKKTYKNWGMGLSFVQKAVYAHLGFIEIKSIVNNYTEIQVMLPNDNIGGDYYY